MSEQDGSHDDSEPPSASGRRSRRSHNSAGATQRAVSFTDRAAAKSRPGAHCCDRSGERRQTEGERRKGELRRVCDHLVAEEVERRRDDEKPRAQQTARGSAEAPARKPAADRPGDGQREQARADATTPIPVRYDSPRSRS